MNATIVSALIRHLLTALGGGFAVSWGIDGQTWEGIVAAIATLGGLGWSVYDKRPR
jgi:hypothetical protein